MATTKPCLIIIIVSALILGNYGHSEHYIAYGNEIGLRNEYKFVACNDSKCIINCNHDHSLCSDTTIDASNTEYFELICSKKQS